MSDAITPALVSLWGHPTDTSPEHFLCSGFFIDDTLVLTVKHVLNGRAPEQIWIRPKVAEGQALDVTLVSKHAQHDAALLRISHMPHNAQCLPIDPGSRHSGDVGAYSLHGYFEGRYETPTEVTIKNFSEGDEQYLSEPRHPKGHSGSAVCQGANVWGMTTAHLTDPTADRGFVLGIHQIFGGWLDNFLPSPTPFPLGPAPRLDAAMLLGDRPQRIKKLRACLERAFSKGFDPQAQTAVKLLDSGLPEEVEQALASDQPDLGKRLVDVLNALQKRLGQQLRAGDLVLAEADRTRLREALREAMVSHATKLCIDPTRLPNACTPDFITHLPVRSRPGAALVGRDMPHLSIGHQGTRADDQHALDYGIESGEGADLSDDLMALLWAHLRPADPHPHDLNDLEFELKRTLYREADNDRQRLIVLKCPSDAANLGRFEAINQNGWFKRMHLKFAHYTDQDAGLFGFMAEADLVGAIDSFLERLQNQPWTTP